MSKLMSVLGIILLAVGLAIGLLEIANPGHLQGMGVNLDTSVSLIVGGVLAIGLGGVIAALERGALAVPGYEETTTKDETAVTEDVETSTGEAAEKPSRKILFPSFGRKAAATTAPASDPAVEEDAPPSVQQTIDALEQAKQDIKGALGGMETILPETDAKESKSDLESDEPPEGELYVIEEKIIRGRPARILSDNTVEAETDEGWMRFENIDHLNEYLDEAHG
jgi:hypothetical protein